MKKKNLYATLKKISDEYMVQLLQFSIASRYIYYVPQFYDWYFKNFDKLFVRKFGNSSKMMSYIVRGGPKVLVNIFAAWLVHNRLATTYELIKGKYVAGAESIYTWLRVIRLLDRHD